QRVAGVSELVLEVDNLERSERFYTEKLGLPVVERWPHRDAIWVLAGMTRIGLWMPQVGLEGSQGGAHVHFALQVDEADFDAIVDTLKKKNLEVPVHEFGGLGEIEAPSRSAYVTDPDGHLVEFWPATMSDYSG